LLFVWVLDFNPWRTLVGLVTPKKTSLLLPFKRSGSASESTEAGVIPPNPQFSHPVRNAHSVPIRRRQLGVSRESIRPGKLLPKQLATGNFLTNLEICEKVRLRPRPLSGDDLFTGWRWWRWRRGRRGTTGRNPKRGSGQSH